jgi:hypothetical protein
VFFRSPDLTTAATLLKTMLVGGPNALWLGEARAATALSIVLLTIVWHTCMRDTTLEAVLPRMPWPARSIALATLALALCVTHGGGRAFIYFQF